MSGLQGASEAHEEAVVIGRRRGPYRLWTEQEIKYLEYHWGEVTLAALAKALHRTEFGITKKARELDLGRANRGTVSLRRFAQISGFSTLKIRQAATALGMRLRGAQRTEPARHGNTRERMMTLDISEEQQEELLAYMLANPHVRKTTGKRTVKGAWGMGQKPAACLMCNKNDRPHYAKGLCTPCYNARLKEQKQVETRDNSIEGRTTS